MIPARLLILCLVPLGGCADAPALDGRISAAAAAAPYPTLQPLGPVLAQAAAPSRIAPGTTQRVESDGAALRARAAALRVPVVDANTRTRMRDGIARAALR